MHPRGTYGRRRKNAAGRTDYPAAPMRLKSYRWAIAAPIELFRLWH
jgi:hypothetical protein